jgi:hypothetical protein
VLAACESLVLVDGEVIGSPLEKAALEVRKSLLAFHAAQTLGCVG